MDRPINSQQIVVPGGFDLLTKAFCKEVIRFNPQDVIAFSADYFDALAKGELEAFLARLEDRRLGQGVFQKQAKASAPESRSLDNALQAAPTATPAASKAVAPAPRTASAGVCQVATKFHLKSSVQNLSEFLEETWMQLLTANKHIPQCEVYATGPEEVTIVETFASAEARNAWVDKLGKDHKRESSRLGTLLQPTSSVQHTFLAGFDRRSGIATTGWLGGSCTDSEEALAQTRDQFSTVPVVKSVDVKQLTRFLTQIWVPLQKENAQLSRCEYYFDAGKSKLLVLATWRDRNSPAVWWKELKQTSKNEVEEWKSLVGAAAQRWSFRGEGAPAADTSESAGVTQDVTFLRGFDNRSDIHVP